MKIIDGFVLKKIAGEYYAVAVGELAEKFHGIVKLNESAADIWHFLEKETDEETVVAEMLELYGSGANEDKIRSDVSKIISTLKENNIMA